MPVSLCLQFGVLRCCVAEQRMFRASSSSVLFHFMLLLGLLMAVATLGFTFYQQNQDAVNTNMYSFYCNFDCNVVMLNTLSTCSFSIHPIYLFSGLNVNIKHIWPFSSRSKDNIYILLLSAAHFSHFFQLPPPPGSPVVHLETEKLC